MVRNPLLICGLLGLSLGLASFAVGTRTVQAQSLEFGEDPPIQVDDARVEARQINEIVSGWSDAQRAEAREAARSIMVNCPYNRAGFQVPLALRATVGRLEGQGLDPQQRALLQRLQDGLVVHVSLVDRISGGELAVPSMADHLDLLDARHLATRAGLMADPDPIEKTRGLVERVQDVVADYPQSVADEIGASRDTLMRLTGDSWPMKGMIVGWRHGLQTLQPALTDPAERQTVTDAISLLDKYLSVGC